MTAEDDAAPARVSALFARGRRGAAAAILLTVALAAFEGLAVTAALPQVAADLGGIDLLPWVIAAFGLTSGVATVASGPLVDSLGASRLFRVAVSLFALGGVAAGLAPSMPLLIAARLVQGVGAGATVAVGLTAIGLVYPARLVGRAFALSSTVWGVMGVAAPAIAATMLTVGSWRWIFLVNLPLGLLALAAGWRTLPVAPARPGRTRVDGVGLLLVGAFTAAVLVAVDRLSWWSLPAAAVAAVVGWAYLRRAQGLDEAVVRPRHVIDAPLGPLAWSVSVLLTGAIAVATYVPLYVQGARGVGPALTAGSVVFFTVGWTLGANGASKLLDRMAESTVLVAGFLVAAPAAAAVSALVVLDAPLWTVFAALVVQGVGVGSATNSGLTLVRALASDDELGRATAAHQFLRNQGITVGSALGGATILLVVARRIGDTELVRDLLSGTSTGAATGVAGAIADGYATAAVIAAVVIAVGLVPLAAVRRHLAPARRRRRAVAAGDVATGSRGTR